MCGGGDGFFGQRFCGGCGGNGSGGCRNGGETCCEAGLRLFDWKDAFLVAFQCNIGGRENMKFCWVSLWYGDAGRFFEIDFLFGQRSSGADDVCKYGDGNSGRDGCGGGCKDGLTQFWDAVGGDGCIGSQWCDYEFGSGGSAKKRSIVISSGGGACAGGKGATERVSCRFSEVF